MTVDAHAHLDHAFGGGWIDRPAAELVRLLDEAGIDVLVDLSGGWGHQVLAAHRQHFERAAPDRFRHLAGIEWARWAAEGAAFPPRAAAELDRALQEGAAGLKVWKVLGLEVRDEQGERVAIDDERLDPIWATCAERGAPVVIHVADPPAFFEPIPAEGQYAEELRLHPDWHWADRTALRPPQLHAELGRVLDRWPALLVVGAHLLDLVDDLPALHRLLDLHPRLHVDLAARAHLLAPDLPGLADLLLAHPERILFGLDHPPSIAQYRHTLGELCTLVHDCLRGAGALAEHDRILALVLDGNARRVFSLARQAGTTR
ncbi:MAG: amidohydrolase family protein [Acidimicrobiales bacterium]